jgi:hypothetical protein
MSYIGWVILIGLAALGAHLIAKRIMPFPSNRREYSVIVVFIFLIIIVVIIVIARHQLPSLTWSLHNLRPDRGVTSPDLRP